MTRVYFIQPMRGRTAEEIIRERQEAEECMEMAIGEIRALPKMVNDMSRGPVYNLGRSLQQMDAADLVVTLPGWEDARGCRIEQETATDYGYNIMDIKRNATGQLVAPIGQMSI